jgi:hypothetical protein
MSEGEEDHEIYARYYQGNMEDRLDGNVGSGVR